MLILVSIQADTNSCVSPVPLTPLYDCISFSQLVFELENNTARLLAKRPNMPSMKSRRKCHRQNAKSKHFQLPNRDQPIGQPDSDAF